MKLLVCRDVTHRLRNLERWERRTLVHQVHPPNPAELLTRQRFFCPASSPPRNTGSYSSATSTIESLYPVPEGVDIMTSSTERFYYPTLGSQASPRKERLDYFQAYNGVVRQLRVKAHICGTLDLSSVLLFGRPLSIHLD